MRLDRFNAHAEGEDLIPVPPGTPTLYVTLRENDADPSNWMGMTPDIVMPAVGFRLITYDISNNKSFKFKDTHRDSYAYGFETMPYQSFSGFWGANPHETNTTMFRVKLKYANQVYVVDEQPFLDMRERELEDRERSGRKATDNDATKIFAAIAQTIVPLAEYQRDFVRPIYLIARHLKADEAQVYMPAFKRRIQQEELARQARVAERQKEFMEDLFAKPKEPPKPRHLHLIVNN